MQHSSQYAITRYPTPVFNTPHLSICFGGVDGNSLPLDDQQLMREVETILFPQTKVELVNQVANSIWKIRAEEYDYDREYYIDDRFVQRSLNIPATRLISLPSLPSIIAKLNTLVGTRYLWGGNWPEGIDLMPRLYPSQLPFNQLPPEVQKNWCLKGVDCSGLLYYVSNGWTPRNTSRLLNFGNTVTIEGLSLDEIVDKLNPLDLIVWEGHVVAVLDHETTIESRSPQGVVTCHLKTRLSEIIKKRKPVNRWNESEGPSFVIRRWHMGVIFHKI